jgi:hypothetical protein
MFHLSVPSIPVMASQPTVECNTFSCPGSCRVGGAEIHYAASRSLRQGSSVASCFAGNSSPSLSYVFISPPSLGFMLCGDMKSRYIISAKSLPSGPSIIFKNSGYFSRNGQNAIFPTPAEILAQSAVQNPSFQDCQERPPVYFKDLGLVVKFGKDPKVSVAEGQCLWALQHVPGIMVPEIYGWTQDGSFTYLFLELVHGVTLEKLWHDLARSERVEICEQLRFILAELRCLQQEPDDVFIGKAFKLNSTC